MNAYLHYHREKISHGCRLKMTQHSKVTGSSWKRKEDTQKRKHYHAAAKDAVEKEIASGGNSLTKKSFEQHENIAFVNEIPIIQQLQPVVQHPPSDDVEDWFKLYINYE